MSTNSPRLLPKAEPSLAVDRTEEQAAQLVSIFPHVDLAHRYARDVVEGREVACRWVRLACQRHLNDLVRAESDAAYPYRFDPAKASRVCRLIEQLPHTKGDWAISHGGRDNRIKLEPWQCFVYVAVFGWLKKATGFRRFTLVYVCVPRKNGKSILAAGTGLYMFASDGEFGAEVYTGATCQRQALEVFRPAKQMVERTPRLREAFGITVGAKNLSIADNGSRFEPIVGDPGDGSSPSCAVIDEFHEHRTARLIDAMRTGMGARNQPLAWVITTAGSNTAGPCYALQRDVEKMLDGTLDRDELFGVIYTLDDEDDWTDEKSLRKANPNYGVSVMPEFLLAEQSAAIQNSAKQNIFKTKHLNIWVGAASSWLNIQKWKCLTDSSLKLEDFRGLPCWIGTDLSSSIDITSVVLVFSRDIDGVRHFYVFSRNYLPRERAQDAERQHYQQWLADGFLIGMPGPTVDYSLLRRGLLEDVAAFEVRAIAFDPWAAGETQQELQRELGEDIVVSIPQRVQYLSYPMKELEALVLSDRIHHNGDPALAWMLSNVVCQPDANDNLFPRKENNDNKIDGAVALIMALSRALVDAGPSFHQYNGF